MLRWYVHLTFYTVICSDANKEFVIPLCYWWHTADGVMESPGHASAAAAESRWENESHWIHFHQLVLHFGISLLCKTVPLHMFRNLNRKCLFSKIVTWMLRIILMEVHIYSWTWSLTDLTKLANVAAQRDTINVRILPCPHEPEHLVTEKMQISIHLHHWLSLVVGKYVDIKDYSKLNLCTKIEAKCTHIVAQCMFSMLI